MAEKIVGAMRYATNNTPAVPAMIVGSADEMVSTAEEAMGLAFSMTFVVCWAAPATVYEQKCIFASIISQELNAKISCKMYIIKRIT